MSEREESGEIEPIYVRMGRRLAALRKDRGLTQEMLSDRAGVSANYLARTEGGYHRPNLAKVEEIAAALEVSVASLFSQRAEPVPEQVLPGLVAELAGLSKDDQRLVLQLVRRLKAGGATGTVPRSYGSEAKKRKRGASTKA